MSWDPDGDPLLYGQSPPGPYALGTTAVMMTVTDDGGLSDSCSGTVTVVDMEDPVVTPPSGLTPECNTTGGVPGSDPDIQAWLASATAADNCSVASFVNDAPGFFPVGAYGEEAYARIELLRAATARAAVFYGFAVGDKSVVVVGDSPRDVESGKAFGARVVAVATGRQTLNELAEYQPDVLLPSLGDWEVAFRAIAGPD